MVKNAFQECIRKANNIMFDRNSLANSVWCWVKHHIGTLPLAFLYFSATALRRFVQNVS